MPMPSYRMKCRECGNEPPLKYMPAVEFERTEFAPENKGFMCPNGKCGAPRMMVCKSDINVKDGFVPGYQRSIRKICNTQKEYEAELKRRGLVVFGYDDIDFDQRDLKINLWDDKMIGELKRDSNIDISGREAQALKDGVLFSDERL